MASEAMGHLALILDYVGCSPEAALNKDRVDGEDLGWGWWLVSVMYWLGCADNFLQSYRPVVKLSGDASQCNVFYGIIR